MDRLSLSSNMRFLAALLTCAFASAQHPDFSGAWEPYRGGPKADQKLAAPPATPLMLKPEYAKPYEARRAAEAASAQRGEPLANTGTVCIPYGMPTMMSIATYPIEIIQTPKQITIITEAFSEVRRVFMDQPPSKIDDVAPGFYGRSTGRWEGDTLVVETVGVKPSIAGYRGMPHSEQMRITERMHLVAPDYLHDDVTLQDPVVLEKPVTFTYAYKRLPGYEMVEFVCDNNREFVDEKGVVHMKVTK